MRGSAARRLARLRLAFAALFVGALLVTNALGIESWPFSSYPMYSVPKPLSGVAVSRFAFELDTGERVLWKPRVPYLAKDLGSMVERDRGRPGFEAELRLAARLVLEDVRHERAPPELARIRRVLVVERRARAEGDGFAVEERLLAAFPVAELP